MDLYALRLDQPYPGARHRDPGDGRVRHLPYPPRTRAGRAPGAVAGAAAGEGEGCVSERARAQVTTPDALPDERLTDAALRPSRLDKTTLALLMAKELAVNIRTTSGPVLERPGDLVGLLTSLGPGDILFIDEVHRLRPVLEEFLYPAMEDYRVDVRIAEGPHAQTIPMSLERFTLIGATTRFGLLTPPMRARFGLVERLAYYPPDDLAQIISRSAGILDVPADAAGIAEIARRSRGTPRVANRLLKRVRDYAQVRAGGKITAQVAAEALKRLDVDEFGLDDMDGRILKTIIEQFEGGPVGLTTIAAAVGEDPGTLEEVYEPFLMQQGFLARTPRGRCATGSAYRHFGFTPPRSAEQPTMFDG